MSVEGRVLIIDNDVNLATNGRDREGRPLDGSIGFVGLGRMGSAMAANLATGGCRVIAYIRRPDRAPEIRALGVEPKFSIADLFDCDVVISMLLTTARFASRYSANPGKRGWLRV